jgi:hypothetical protein
VGVIELFTPPTFPVLILQTIWSYGSVHLKIGYSSCRSFPFSLCSISWVPSFANEAGDPHQAVAEVHRHARNAARLLSAALLRRQTEGTMRLSVDLGRSAQIGFP